MGIFVTCYCFSAAKVQKIFYIRNTFGNNLFNAGFLLNNSCKLSVISTFQRTLILVIGSWVSL